MSAWNKDESGGAADALLLGESLRAYLEASPNGTLLVDDEGKIVFANATAAEIFGYSRAELEGSSIEELLPEDYREGHVGLRRSYQEDPHPRPMGLGMELPARRRGGEVVPVEVSLCPLETPNGRLVTATVTDLTERRSLRDQLLRSQKLEAVGRLASGVAHDFNGVLTLILTAADFLTEDLPEGSPLHQDVEEIRRAGARAAALTRRLLAFARREPQQPRPCDPNVAVREMQRLLQRLLGEDVELCCELDEDAPRVLADPAQLEQVILNLALNARDAMPEGGRLTIATRAVPSEGGSSDQVELRVEDTGTGMDEDTRARLFEAFFTTKPPGQGTGLGLAIVQDVADALRGTVEVESAPGEGALFRIRFPGTPEAASPEDGPGTRRTSGDGRVLVVDDDAQLRSLTARSLRRLGYAVREADGAAEAQRAAADGLDVLVTDLVMPGEGGAAVADRVRLACPSVRVLFVSGYPDAFRQAQAAMRVGDGFLAKPFTPATLGEKLREILAPIP